MYDSQSVRRGMAGKRNIMLRMHRTGRTAAGQLLWTQDEIDILEDLWPDRSALVVALPRRTLGAICKKAQERRLTTPRKFWQPDERGRMVPPYKAGELIADVVEKVGTRTKRQIYSKASHLGVKRPRKRPKPTGMRIVDLIRERAFSKGYTMADLDAWIPRKRYFVRPNGYDWWAISQALSILGGKLVTKWPESEAGCLVGIRRRNHSMSLAECEAGVPTSA